ncbi:MAG: TetR/AcrR family transcriptional regulator [Desulfobulbaceae bacterium]|jgi:AcrR family transcriptional regulator|nr:TetR/AcrR family transcriptional regulator [Desulfobulbaceae bacterium]
MAMAVSMRVFFLTPWPPGILLTDQSVSFVSTKPDTTTMAQRNTKKQAIIDHATLLFADRGFSAASMNDVAAQAEVASASIFYHFKTKEDLYIAVLENAKDGILREFSEYLAGAAFDNGLEKLLAAVSFHLHLSETRRYWFLLLQHPFTHELAATSAVCRAHLHDIYSCLLNILEDALKQGREDGSIRDTPVNKTALIILAAIDGLRQLEQHHLYAASSLFTELLELCRHMLSPQPNQTP